MRRKARCLGGLKRGVVWVGLRWVGKRDDTAPRSPSNLTHLSLVSEEALLRRSFSIRKAIVMVPHLHGAEESQLDHRDGGPWPWPLPLWSLQTHARKPHGMARSTTRAQYCLGLYPGLAQGACACMPPAGFHEPALAWPVLQLTMHHPPSHRSRAACDSHTQVPLVTPMPSREGHSKQQIW